MAEASVSDGLWAPGMAYLRLGSGTPLVSIPGLTPHHRPLTGASRKSHIASMARYSRNHEVWSVNRPMGLAPGTTIGDLARTYSTAIRAHFDAPVDLMGTSTGGSIALQLAADHPNVVRRLVVVASACRLGAGRHVQREAATAVRAGRPRRAFAELAATSAAHRWSRNLLWMAGWLLEPAAGRHGYTDMLTVIDAEDHFDLSDRLADIVNEGIDVATSTQLTRDVLVFLDH